MYKVITIEDGTVKVTIFKKTPEMLSPLKAARKFGLEAHKQGRFFQLANQKGTKLPL